MDFEMKYFLQNKTGDEVDRIVSRLNKFMDGDVSTQMRQKGVDYKKNYGASILWLKNLAKEYIGDNVLAERLWLREIRETMVLATIIANPDESFYSVVKEWMSNIVSDELAEQIGVNLLWRMDDVSEFCGSILTDEDERTNAAAWVGLAVFLQRGGVLNPSDVRNFLVKIRSDLFSSKASQRAKGRFLRMLCRSDKEFIPEVENLLTVFAENNELAWLVEDVKTEITYLNSL